MVQKIRLHTPSITHGWLKRSKIRLLPENTPYSWSTSNEYKETLITRKKRRRAFHDNYFQWYDIRPIRRKYVKHMVNLGITRCNRKINPHPIFQNSSPQFSFSQEFSAFGWATDTSKIARLAPREYLEQYLREPNHSESIVSSVIPDGNIGLHKFVRTT